MATGADSQSGRYHRLGVGIVRAPPVKIETEPEPAGAYVVGSPSAKSLGNQSFCILFNSKFHPPDRSVERSASSFPQNRCTIDPSHEFPFRALVTCRFDQL